VQEHDQRQVAVAAGGQRDVGVQRHAVEGLDPLVVAEARLPGAEPDPALGAQFSVPNGLTSARAAAGAMRSVASSPASASIRALMSATL
jgi:hypothetical protein